MKEALPILLPMDPFILYNGQDIDDDEVRTVPELFKEKHFILSISLSTSQSLKNVDMKDYLSQYGGTVHRSMNSAIKTLSEFTTQQTLYYIGD